MLRIIHGDGGEIFNVAHESIEVATLDLVSVGVGDAVGNELEASLVDELEGKVCHGGDDAGGVETIAGELNEKVDGAEGVHHGVSVADLEIIADRGTGSAEGCDAFELVLELDPVGECPIGELGVQQVALTEQAELIAAADLVRGDRSGCPRDLNGAAEQREHHGVNGGGLSFGVDEHGRW